MPGDVQCSRVRHTDEDRWGGSVAWPGAQQPPGWPEESGVPVGGTKHEPCCLVPGLTRIWSGPQTRWKRTPPSFPRGISPRGFPEVLCSVVKDTRVPTLNLHLRRELRPKGMLRRPHGREITLEADKWVSGHGGWSQRHWLPRVLWSRAHV